jgi:hypothetical protein
MTRFSFVHEMNGVSYVVQRRALASILSVTKRHCVAFT